MPIAPEWVPFLIIAGCAVAAGIAVMALFVFRPRSLARVPHQIVALRLFIRELLPELPEKTRDRVAELAFMFDKKDGRHLRAWHRCYRRASGELRTLSEQLRIELAWFVATGDGREEFLRMLNAQPALQEFCDRMLEERWNELERSPSGSPFPPPSD